MPKVYFLDVGICARLQSHQEANSILMSPHAGHLFESLVLSEIIKTKQNFCANMKSFSGVLKIRKKLILSLKIQTG